MKIYTKLTQSFLIFVLLGSCYPRSIPYDDKTPGPWVVYFNNKTDRQVWPVLTFANGKEIRIPTPKDHTTSLVHYINGKRLGKVAVIRVSDSVGRILADKNITKANDMRYVEIIFYGKNKLQIRRVTKNYQEKQIKGLYP